MTSDSPTELKASAARQDWGVRPYQPRRQETVAKMKARQSAKIREFKEALVTAGIGTLDAQAKALGLNRSTAWSIIQGNHKSSGLSATTINRILAAPNLPPLVRAKILEYVQEKAAGLYGHSKKQRCKFIALLSAKHVERVQLEGILRIKPDARITKIAMGG